MSDDGDGRTVVVDGDKSAALRAAALEWTPTASEKQGSSYFHAVSVVRRIVVERHDRPNLVTNIACEVGAEIVENQRTPGEDLNTVELARKYKTSRTPAREALMLLENEGLVQNPPRRRPRVAVFDPTEVREIYLLRSELLAMAASSVAQNATEAEQARLGEELDSLKRAYEQHDLEQYLWANVEFHNQLTILAHNKTAKRIIDSLLLRTIRLRRISLSQGPRMDRSMTNHIQLYEAFLDRDPILASALIRSNHLQALAALETWLRSDTAQKIIGASGDE